MKNIIKLWTGIVLLQCVVVALAAVPKFDPTTRMKLVLVPADAAVGSVIYRLRATDDEFDYPLTFELVGMKTSFKTFSTSSCNKIKALFKPFYFPRILIRWCVIVNSSNRYIRMYEIQFNMPSECCIGAKVGTRTLL